MSLTDPSTLLLILLAVTAAVLLLRTRGRLVRQRQQWATEDTEARDYGVLRRDGSSAGFPPNGSPPNGHLPNNLAQWEVEMHETARQLSAQLDAKLGLLQALIDDAQQAAARLENALDRAYPALRPGSQAESLRPVAGHGRDLGDFDSTVVESSPSASDDEPPPADRARRRAEIYRLADYGFAATEIARRVGSPVGEVELILSLRQQSPLAPGQG